MIMDTPKQQAFWLDSFPSDIWAYIAFYLPAEQLGRLMMTGATLLWRRLNSPGVVKSTKLGKDFIVFKSFPRFLSDLCSLDELYIHSNNDEWSGNLGLMIDSIPSGVRKLVLSGIWSYPLFGENGSTLKLNEHLPHLDVLDLIGVRLTSESWIRHSPESLTKLKLESWNGTVELPTSLIHFETKFMRLSTSSFVPTLPPSLETFEVRYSVGLELLVALLPPSIRTLSLGRAPRTSDGRQYWPNLEQLPKSLTRFEVGYLTIPDFDTNPAMLPSGLTKLHLLYYVPCSVWHLLPPQLTDLSFSVKESLSTVASKTIDSRGVHHEVRSIPFGSLPKSITSLGLHNASFFCGPPTQSERSPFLPQLTSLEMSNIQLSPEMAKLLPATLTYLEIANLCERVCENLSNSIKTLVPSAAFMTPNLIKFLPKYLTSLHLNLPGSDYHWFDYNTGKTIDSVLALEEYSIQNDCTSRSFDWKDHSPLPSTLTKLHVQGAEKLGDTFLRHQQLPNLMELVMDSSKHFTDLSIPLLPPHLTILDLGGSSNISGRVFHTLPRALTQLNLHSSESIFDSDVQHLPRTLKRAILNHAKHLTDVCIPDLPPHLERLEMGLNLQISGFSFPKLPYPLRSSQIKESAVFFHWVVQWGLICGRLKAKFLTGRSIFKLFEHVIY